MFYHCAFQLRIASEVPLPELPSFGHGGDVEICLRTPQAVVGRRSIEWNGTDGTARFTFPGAGSFLVRDGNRVLVTPDLPTDLALLRLYLQGMMLAALLSQRGYFVLHASVVQMGNSAIAFVGPVGAGKSTLAAALRARGYTVVADDNAAIDLANLAVLPAFPSLKVYPEIARALGYDPDALEPMHASQIKRAQNLDSGFATHSIPLDRVYVLSRSKRSDIRRLTPVEAVKELILDSVPARWGISGDASNLAMCGQIAGCIPLYAIQTFSDLPGITEVANRIEDHVYGSLPQGESLLRTCTV